jgi:hypothetical protein
MIQYYTPAIRLEIEPKTPVLKVRLAHLTRLVETNPPLHSLHCLFPDACRVMGQDFYVSKTADGLTVKDGAEVLATIFPRLD